MTSDEVNGAEHSIPLPFCIRFSKKGPANQYLIASVEPNDDFPLGIARDTIRGWIREQGCEDWWIDEEAIAHLSREVNRLERTREYTVAEQKDCGIEIQVAADRLKAWIRVSRSYGGTPLTEALIRQALEEHQVNFGINEELLRQILQEGECERVLIAEGVPPLPGENARFEPLVHESTHKGAPQERADGTVDYKNLGLFLSVAPGTPLMKRIPPSEGTPGTAIDGNSIPAPQAFDRSPHAGVGTAISDTNPDVVVATRAGQPYFEDNSVRVDQTLEVASVNPSTGNVSFDGNIIIRGPVEPGFKVEAGQDLTILDTVEGADLVAGRNLSLITGVYGRSKTNITVEGNLEARFLSDCTVRCGGNIEIIDLIAHCNVECGGILYVGKHGGKGQISGGRLLALREIRAQILGTVSEASTVVEIGPSRSLIHRKARVDEKLDAFEQELAGIEKELIDIEIRPQGREQMGETLHRKAAELFEAIGELKKEQEMLQGKLEASGNGRIRAEEVHRGVTLCIGPRRQTVSERITYLDFRMPDENTPSV